MKWIISIWILASTTLAHLPHELEQAIQASVESLNQQMPKVPTFTHDEKVLSMAYQTFLANQKPHLAFEVALAHVQHNPQNIGWIDKVIESSLWTNHQKLALSFLIKRHDLSIEERKVQQALALSQTLKLPYVVLHILGKQKTKHALSEREHLMYAHTLANLGYPELAIEHLKHQKLTPVLVKALQLLAINTDNQELHLSLAKQLASSKLTFPQLEALVEAYCSVHQYQHALSLLNNQKIYFDRKRSYHALRAKIANLQNQYDISLQSYEMLSQSNKLTTQELETYLALLSDKKQYHKAYSEALNAWQQYPSVSLAQHIMALGKAQKAYHSTWNFMKKLPKQLLEILSYHHSFWLAYIELAKNISPQAKSQILSHAYRYFPSHPVIWNQYLHDTLVHNRPLPLSLEKTLASDIWEDNQLLMVFYLMKQQKPQQAQTLLHDIQSNKPLTLAWLDTYEDLLDDMGYRSQAYHARLVAIEKNENEPKLQDRHQELFLQSYPGHISYHIAQQNQSTLDWLNIYPDPFLFQVLSEHRQDISGWSYANNADEKNAHHFYLKVSKNRNEASPQALNIAHVAKTSTWIYEQAIQLDQAHQTQVLAHTPMTYIPARERMTFGFEKKGYGRTQNLQSFIKCSHQRPNRQFETTLWFDHFQTTLLPRPHIHEQGELQVRYKKRLNHGAVHASMGVRKHNLYTRPTGMAKLYLRYPATLTQYLAFHWYERALESEALVLLGEQHILRYGGLLHFDSVHRLSWDLSLHRAYLLKAKILEYGRVEAALYKDLWKSPHHMMALFYINSFWRLSAFPVPQNRLNGITITPLNQLEFGLGLDINAHSVDTIMKRPVPILSLRLGHNTRQKLTFASDIGITFPLISHHLIGQILYRYSTNRFNGVNSNHAIRAQLSLLSL